MKYWRDFAVRHPDAANGLVLAAVMAIGIPIAGHYLYWRFVAVFVIGALVGIGELVARYRDAPQSALWTFPAFLYIAINAFGAVVAIYVVQTFHYAESPNALQTRITHIFLAGFGAMAFFRSSVFITRVGEQDIPVGPAVFLQVVLRATDRAVDRIRARARAEFVAKRLDGISFERAYTPLPAFCLQLMQNVSPEEQNDVATALKAIQGTAELDNDTKVKNLALILLNVVGEEVLSVVIDKFGQQIEKTVRITVNGAPPSLPVGGTADLSATCFDSAKEIPHRQPAWSSDDPTVASVTAGGHVVALKAGTTLLRAKSDDTEAAMLLTVT